MAVAVAVVVAVAAVVAAVAAAESARVEGRHGTERVESLWFAPSTKI